MIPTEFRAALDSEPSDRTLLLVIADFLAEQGDSLGEEALRWCAEKGRYPHRTRPVFPSAVTGWWWCYWYRGPGFPERATIPHGLYEELDYKDPPDRETRSPSRLFSMLLESWKKGTSEQRAGWWQWEPAGASV